MQTTLRFILLTAIRDRLFPVLIILMAALLGVTMALSETVMLEEAELHLAMSAGIGRIVLNMGIAIFVCFHVRALYENREIDVMLSRPISRPQLVFAFWFGFAIVAALLVLALTLMLLVLKPNSVPDLAIWSASLLLESWVVVAIALFASLTNKSAVTSVLVSFTFYTLGRLMAFFVATAQSRINAGNEWVAMILRNTVEVVSVVMPRLDMFADTSWLVYGLKDGQEVLYFAAQSLIFIPFILAIAIIDFCRKQF